MPDFSRHQKKIISRYYEHHGEIMLTRLQEIVSELYLADSEAKTNRLWTRAGQAMKNLKISPKIIDHILAQRKVEILAKNLQGWLTINTKK